MLICSMSTFSNDAEGSAYILFYYLDGCDILIIIVLWFGID